ncbi:response regulator transcription factor [Nocardioides sp. W7]|uniref:response regulator transcription factor n=1 Tax=Nocardioides sp. W7 TaxID=2931390 RepID=UPI001FD00C84|nr:response regulator transcription factor [Nocardioides sp. W7]
MPATCSAPQVSRPLRPAHLAVLVASDQPLVADAVHTALISQGLEAFATPVSRGPISPSQTARLLQLDSTVLLVISDLSRSSRLEGVRTMIDDLKLPAVVLSGTEGDVEWGAVLESGASVVLPESATLDEVVRALRGAVRGALLVPPRRRQELVDEWRRTVQERYELAARLASLSPREREVLRMLYLGESVQEIAERTGVAVATVRSHVRSVLRKLGVSSQLSAVAVYAQLGLLGGDGG